MQDGKLTMQLNFIAWRYIMRFECYGNWFLQFSVKDCFED